MLKNFLHLYKAIKVVINNFNSKAFKNKSLILCHKRQLQGLERKAKVKGSQLQLFKAKERRGYSQRVLVCTNTQVLPLHTAYANRASARDHVT
jgi:hypothetical protein